MPLIFPGNPTVGQTYTVGVRTWIWSGTRWSPEGPDIIDVTGPPGATGVSITNANVVTGNLIVTLSSNTSINAGYVLGATGATGLFVTEANIVAGNLNITLSNSSVINAGIVTGATGATGATGPGVALAIEPFNVITNATGVVAHDYNQGGLWAHTTISSNFTANFTNVPTANNNVVSFSLILYQGATPYLASNVQIDGAAQTILWADAIVPTVTANRREIASFSLFRLAGAWTVTGSLSSFG